MKEQFVTYEIALKLKELGFDEECSGMFPFLNTFQLTKKPYRNYNKEYEVPLAAPLWQQAIDWLSYNYKITIRPRLYDDNYELHKIEWDEDSILILNNKEQAILKAIELCKK